jgi:ABC-2 type transport system ATP-binding protein
MGPPDDLKRRVRTEALSDPTMEDAFIALIHEFDDGSRDAVKDAKGA